MADIKSPEERSRNMSKIRSKDTDPEIWFRKKLFARGYRYRKNVSYIPGHPDLWLAKYNLVIFVHGCFWHRHPGCRYAYTPKSRQDFWCRKFENNVNRDRTVRQQLEEQNIRCLIIWACAIKWAKKDAMTTDSLVETSIDFIKSDGKYLEISMDGSMTSKGN